MKFLSALLILFTSLNSFSQDQSGYYITSSNQKVEGYFKTGNFDNASSLQFRKAADAEFTTLDSNLVQEYGIGTEYKYEKHTVKIDKSENFTIQLMTGTKDPLLEVETVFLNVLVEGDATLYSYQNGGATKFFFRAKDKQPDIVPLIFKKYSPSSQEVLENNAYRQQLFNTLNCGGEKSENYSRINYSKKSLMNFFMAQNECLGSKAVTYANSTGNKIEMKFALFAGAYLADFGIDGSQTQDTEMGTSFSIGGELSMIAASKKWELFGGFEFEMLSAEKSDTYDTGFNTTTTTYSLDAQVINIFIGPRYNFIINDNNKLFIDVAGGFCIPFGETEMTTLIRTSTGLEYDGVKDTYDLSSTLFGNFGLGYVFKERLGIALRYETNRNMFDNTATALSTKITRIGLNLKYILN